MKWAFVFALLILVCCTDSNYRRRFPYDFLFGAATSAYQIEGGWDADGKGENIWDYLIHTWPSLVIDSTNGDIAADSYHKYERDVEMMREMGLDAYRFSISWSRILPTGLSNKVNNEGIEFYNNYINEMRKYRIIPIVTLYHWDLPQNLQELGGFASPEFPDWFEEYARLVFKTFGDRVKYFITFNEPKVICYQGYGGKILPSQADTDAVGEYLCAKNLLLAHARAYNVYNKEFKLEQEGVCGITIGVNWIVEANDLEENKAAAELKRQAEWGLYADPIFSKEGGFPKELAVHVALKSKKQGFPKSRMPELTEEEKQMIRGTYDFFGVNHYTAYLVLAKNHMNSTNTNSSLEDENHMNSTKSKSSLEDDVDVRTFFHAKWQRSVCPSLMLVPNSICKALSQLRSRYGNLTFYITENGWPDSPPGYILDDERIAYIRASAESMLNCLEDGIKLKGYMVWSLMDNFQWLLGYTERFGLYRVDFNSPRRTRTPRKSALVYKHLIKTRLVDYRYDPKDLTMTIDKGF